MILRIAVLPWGSVFLKRTLYFPEPH